ncbi:hypothetical protein GCM10009595_01340 [Falsarthrobacter nasiphocae]
MLHYVPGKEAGANSSGPITVFLDSQRGSLTVSHVRFPEARAILWLKCTGGGMVTVEVKGHAGFSSGCDSADHVIRHSFPMDGVTAADVSVRASPAQTWSLTVQGTSKTDAPSS